MKRIPLTQGKFALVDDSDYEDLNRYKWCVMESDNIFYALRSVRISKNKYHILMHRVILGLSRGDGLLTDHIDRNGLNNQRNNLRIVNHSQSSRNRRLQSNNSSGYRGVSWHGRRKKWRAAIQVGSQYKYLGYFSSKVNAALAYNNAALKYCGEFAQLNEGIGDG